MKRPVITLAFLAAAHGGCTSASTDGQLPAPLVFDAACLADAGLDARPEAAPPATSAPCQDCLERACGAPIAACYGAGWARTDLSGGACAPCYGCISRCSCASDDARVACWQGCGGSLSDGCRQCAAEVGACVGARCDAACARDAGKDGAPD